MAMSVFYMEVLVLHFVIVCSGLLDLVGLDLGTRRLCFASVLSIEV